MQGSHGYDATAKLPASDGKPEAARTGAHINVARGSLIFFDVLIHIYDISKAEGAPKRSRLGVVPSTGARALVYKPIFSTVE